MSSYAKRDRITPSERCILALVAEGASNERIASELDVSLETVKSQLAGARTKLGARDRAHAAALAVLRGLDAPVAIGRAS